MDYEGHCDYHLGPSFSVSWSRPWCRTLANCGEQHPAGSWTYCDSRAVERRRFPDGKLYTSKEVQDHYGKGQDAAQKWQDARPYVEKRMARDHNSYTVHEFRDHYPGTGEGWLESWKAAGPELRVAPDGKVYSFEEFVGPLGHISLFGVHLREQDVHALALLQRDDQEWRAGALEERMRLDAKRTHLEVLRGALEQIIHGCLDDIATPAAELTPIEMS